MKGRQGNYHAVSLSGGKDSTAMLLMMIERDMPIDAVLTADTGMEFPEMYEHIVDGKLVDPDKPSPFVEQVMADVEQAAQKFQGQEQAEKEQEADTADLIGKELTLDGHRFVIESIGQVSGDVTMRDLTFVENKGFPINRVEKIDTVRHLLEQTEKEVEPPAPPAPKHKSKVSPFVLHPEVPTADRHEYRITDDAIGVGTPGERFNNNVRAIRLLKKLESEERFATPEEQAVLAQYVGWGGLADCFDERHSKYAELKALLDEDEYPTGNRASHFRVLRTDHEPRLWKPADPGRSPAFAGQRNWLLHRNAQDQERLPGNPYE